MGTEPRRDIPAMTDAEFDEWTDVRKRGFGFMRRKMFLMNALVAGIVIGADFLLLYLRIIPDHLRSFAIQMGGLLFVVPWLVTIVFARMIWDLREKQYEQACRLRMQEAESADEDSGH